MLHPCLDHGWCVPAAVPPQHSPEGCPGTGQHTWDPAARWLRPWLHGTSSHPLGQPQQPQLQSLLGSFCDPDRPCCEGTGGQGPQQHLEGGAARSTPSGLPTDRQRLGVRGARAVPSPTPSRAGSSLGHSCSKDSRQQRTHGHGHRHIWNCSGRSGSCPRSAGQQRQGCHSGGAGQCRLGTVRVSLHPTRATLGHAAVPTHSPREKPHEEWLRSLGMFSWRRGD